MAAVSEALDTEASLVDVIWGPQPAPAEACYRDAGLVQHREPPDDAHTPLHG